MELESLASRGCWALFEAMRKHSLSSEHFLALCIYIALGSSFRLSVANRSIDDDSPVQERPKENFIYNSYLPYLSSLRISLS